MYPEIKEAIDNIQHGAKKVEYEDEDYEIVAYRVVNVIRIDLIPKLKINPIKN